jgi:glycosyltransferase involved in cell wall biosynthesis
MKIDPITKNKISVVIAAYNEAPRIAQVLSVVEHHPLVHEVIVINDGSTDITSEIIQKFNVTLIENNVNIGKTLSVKKGIKASKNDLIMLLDADLQGLTKEAVSNLAKPVIDGRVDWTLSLRNNSFHIMKLLKVDWVSGERVIPKNLLMDPLIWSNPNIGYGLETLINKSLLRDHKTFRSVYLPNVTNTNKAKKIGFLKGWVNDFKMVGQISKVIPLHKFFGQFIHMSYLNRKYSKQ